MREKPDWTQSKKKFQEMNGRSEHGGENENMLNVLGGKKVKRYIHPRVRTHADTKECTVSKKKRFKGKSKRQQQDGDQG